MANWSGLDSVQEHIQKAALYVAGGQVAFHSAWLSGSSMESPLEAVFWVWWTALQHAGKISDDVRLRPQHEVTRGSSKRRYRLDFALLPKDGLSERAAAVGIPISRIAVELDGHDFHERTRAQVASRNQRDRDLQSDGWTVLHYSGSELWSDPERCIDDAFGHAYRAFGSWSFEMRIIEAESAIQPGVTV